MRRRSFLALPLTLSAAPGSEIDAAGLQQTLTQYVTDSGKVRYGALKADLAPLDRFVTALKSFDPERLPSREARLAHWINAYNALILWSFASDYPQEKDRLRNPLKRASYFYRRKFLVAGKERSLDDIEVNSIRKAFREPRIHFALVCASASCPWLSREVYRGANVVEKLEQDAVRYLNAERNVKVDVGRKELTISEIFKWFRDDFGSGEAGVLLFLSKYIKSARLSEPGWKLKYFEYDWSVNDQPG